MGTRHNQRGDTLIEVLLAMAILSLVIVGANALMNFGTQKAITATEHTQVSNLISGQAELLRYLRDHAGQPGNQDATQDWQTILTKYVDDDVEAIDFCQPKNLAEAFYITADYPKPPGQPAQDPPDITIEPYGDGETSPPPGSPDFPHATPGEGLWIEAVADPSNKKQEYTDFHVRACWDGIGGVTQRSSTIVRLRTE